MQRRPKVLAAMRNLPTAAALHFDGAVHSMCTRTRMRRPLAGGGIKYTSGIRNVADTNRRRRSAKLACTLNDCVNFVGAVRVYYYYLRAHIMCSNFAPGERISF